MKTNNTLKRLLFSTLFIALFGVYASAQTAAYDSIINGNLQFYAGLDKSEMESDYLFNKGFIVLEDMEKWYTGIPIISKPWKWRYIYEAVSSSCLSNCLNFPAYDSLTSFNNIDRFGTSTINLACLNIKGDYITQANITEHAENDEDIEFENVTLFSGSVLHSKSYSSDIEFYWNSQNYFSNQNGTESLSINFGDETGWHVLPMNSYEVFYVSYSCVGDKNITFRSINGIDTTYSFSSITVLQSQPIIPTSVDTLSVNVEDSTDNSQSRMAIPGNGNLLVSGEYVYFQGYDGKLDKPVIFIEGFDIAGTENSFTLVGYNHLENLNSNGYDVFYLSFINSGKSLLENALIVKELIKFINDNKVDHFEGVLYGESMGGILGRIALKQLENEGYDHQIGLFVANDSPMKGANIPLGLQWMLNDVLLSFGYYMVFTTDFVEMIESIFNTDIFLLDILDQLSSTAARQMIIRHYMGNSDYLFMQAYLDILGYPENCRNVCASSGGENIPENVIPAFPDQDMLNTPPINVGIFMVDFFCRYSGVNQNDYLVSQVSYWNIFSPSFINYIRRREDFNFQKFDSAPGGYIDFDALLNSIQLKFCFVPTSSSIGLETSIFNSAQGLELFNRNNENELISEGSIPFDDVYFNKFNSYHTSGFEKETELDSMEIMYDAMYLQNRVISNVKNFESSDSIEIGQSLRIGFNNIPTAPLYMFSSYIPDPYKNIQTGNFVVSETGKVKFESGTKISLLPGTEFLSGSEVELLITPPDPNLQKQADQTFIDQIDFEYKDCSLKIIGSNSNITHDIEFNLTTSEGEFIPINIPQSIHLRKGQYSLSYSTRGSSNSMRTSLFTVQDDCFRPESLNYFRPSNNKVFAYPNPSAGKFTIAVSEFNSSEQIKYKIHSSAGNVIIQGHEFDGKINLEKFPSGVYILEINSINANYFVKLIKL